MGAREDMVAAAERLFADRGIEGVSLREVGAAAGQRNNSAAQYHFGSKQGLVRAIVETRMAPVDEHRLRLLDQAGPDPTVRQLVEAAVVPFAESGHPDYTRFLQQLLLRDPTLRDVGTLDGPVMTGLRRVFDGLAAAGVGLARRRLFGALFVHAVAACDDPRVVVDMLTASLIEGEPCAPSTTAPVRSRVSRRGGSPSRTSASSSTPTPA